MKKTGSVVWLIIFLCTIVLGIYSLWGYGWHLRKTKDLRREIESLKGKIEEYSSPLSTPSATPSATASPSAKPLTSSFPELKQESTISGKIE